MKIIDIKMDKLTCGNICGQVAKNNLQMFQCKSILCPQTVFKEKKTCNNNLNYKNHGHLTNRTPR